MAETQEGRKIERKESGEEGCTGEKRLEEEESSKTIKSIIKGREQREGMKKKS